MASRSFRTLEAGFEAWNRRDFDSVMESFSEDVVWRTGDLMPDVESVYEGTAGVRQFFRDFIEPWEEISVEIEEVVEDREDQIVVLVSFHARGREQIEVGGRFLHIYRYDQRHLCREFIGFTEEERDQALQEAGLR
jgi:ketosteroid isomerase-like protein